MVRRQPSSGPRAQQRTHHTGQHGSAVRAEHEFFGDVCDALAGITEVLVTGSHTAQADFKHYVTKHRPAVAAQIAGGSRSIFGVMVESNLQAGAQKFTPGKDDPAKLEYGRSITDACIGWDDSVRTLEVPANAVKKRRRK